MNLDGLKKPHVMNGIKTNVITYIEVTDSYIADTVMLKKLVFNTSKNFRMKEVSADIGYLSQKNLQLIAQNSAIPYIHYPRNIKKI